MERYQGITVYWKNSPEIRTRKEQYDVQVIPKRVQLLMLGIKRYYCYHCQ